MRKFCRVIGLLLGLGTASVYGQVFPADFARVLVTNGLLNPTAMAFAPDGRIFVAEQAGKLRVIKNNALVPTAFMQLSVNSSGERGLIGIALDPDFATNNYLYVYYTVPTAPIHNRISRFTANGDVVVPGSESIVLELDPLSGATNHNGGAIHFGKDGKLYVAIGENANTSHAQNLDTYHGKLLRINKDGSVPAGNPYATGSEQRKRIWAHGLRNPYTFSVHPETGRILVNDVGQGSWEEVNDATTGGKNFGWPTTEGTFNQATYPNFANPVYAYPQGSGDGKGCAITGGTFFYPSTTNYPAVYWGKYFFQDLCNQWINFLDLSGAAARSPFATSTGGANLGLAVGTDGNLYYLSRSSSALYKVIYNKTTAPFITNHPAALTVAEGSPGSFSVSALGSTPFTFQWRKNGANIDGATTATLTIDNAVPSDAGEYSVVVSNAEGSAISNAAVLTVVANTLPVAEILTPVAGTTYTAGTSIDFSGTARDAEDGDLPASAFQWQINFHHDTHTHDEPGISGVKNGTFLIPDEGETSHNVWYRIVLTVTDSRGMSSTDEVEILPRKSVITLATNPPGLEVTVEGQPIVTPLDITSVEGILRTFGVSSPVTLDGVQYEFESWSNGGESTQTLATPADDLQLTANFSVIVGVEENGLGHTNNVMFPNPAQGGAVTIKMVTKQPGDVSVRMVNFLSQEVMSIQEHVPAGEHYLPLKFGKISNGIYSVIIKTTGDTVIRKLVVSD
ncbi:MAG TPA: PQQ-dependent sugar dehydrogenase [Chryseolinea sp.]